MTTTATREQVLGFRVRAQQLDREHGTPDDTAVLDIGVQDTGTDGGDWALALRGVDVPALRADDLVLAWTVRGAPHLYRRQDLPQVAEAVAPWSDADAGKRIMNAAKPLKAAGITHLAALDRVAGVMREVVRQPTVKGEASRLVADRMDAPYLKDCVPCGAVHLFEMPFRLAALRAGLELERGTSPPVLRPVQGGSGQPADPQRLDLVRGYLRLLGPATPALVASYVDAPVKDVKARWPADAVEVAVDGERRWVLAEDAPRLDAAPVRLTRLLGAFDLFLQARDHALLVPDPAQAAQLWPTLGRPGGVLVDGEVVGTWRGRKAGEQLTVAAQLWGGRAERAALEEQAERLAAHRGLRLAGVEVS